MNSKTSSFHWVYGISGLLAVLILVIDFNTPLGVATGLLYVLIIFLLGIFAPHPRAVVVGCCVTSLLIVTGYFFSPPGGETWKVIGNRVLSLGAVWLLWLYFKADRGSVSKLFATLNEKSEIENVLLHHQSILDSTLEGIFGVDQKGVITFCNQAGADTLGYRVDELVGQVAHSLLHNKRADGLDYPAESCPINEVLRKGKAIRVEEEAFWHKEGVPIVVKYNSNPLMVNGKAIGAVVVFESLEDERRMTRHIKNQDLWIQNLVDHTYDGIVAINEKGLIQMFNPGAERLFGYQESEVLGRNVNCLMPEPYQTHHDQYLENYLNTRVGKIIGVGREVVGLRKDGSEFPFFLGIGEFELDGEKHFIGTVHDLREQKEVERKLRDQNLLLESVNLDMKQEINQRLSIEKQLKEAVKSLKKKNFELDRFAYITSHDLKAPLRGISSLAEWIEQDMGSDLPEEVGGHLSMLKGRVGRMQALIDGILAYSRAGQKQGTQRPMNLAEELPELVQLIAAPDGFQIHLPPELPVILGERFKVQQVFQNLIQNALSHHDQEAGSIGVSWSHGEEFFEFRVEDDGPGIPAEFHERVFEIFQRLEARDKKEGTGVGLAIVKKIIEEEGGRIWIEAREPRGAVFAFTWPKNQDALSGQAQNQAVSNKV